MVRYKFLSWELQLTSLVSSPGMASSSFVKDRVGKFADVGVAIASCYAQKQDYGVRQCVYRSCGGSQSGVVAYDVSSAFLSKNLRLKGE